MTVMKGKNTGSMTCAGPGMNPVFRDGGGAVMEGKNK
jgi:hypothetical protein